MVKGIFRPGRLKLIRTFPKTTSESDQNTRTQALFFVVGKCDLFEQYTYPNMTYNWHFNDFFRPDDIHSTSSAKVKNILKKYYLTCVEYYLNPVFINIFFAFLNIKREPPTNTLKLC